MMADQALPFHPFALGLPEVHMGKDLVTPTRKVLALLIYLAIDAAAV